MEPLDISEGSRSLVVAALLLLFGIGPRSSGLVRVDAAHAPCRGVSRRFQRITWDSMIQRYLLAVLSCVPLVSADAQDTLVVKPGDRIRISVSPTAERAAGSVLRLEHDSVFLRPCAACSIEAFPETLATSVEVRRSHG